MKRPTNILALRAELCKALRNSISEYGYDEENVIQFANGNLHNVITVCDEWGENNLCFIEVKEDRVVFWMPCTNNMVDNTHIVEYYYVGNKTDFFIRCAFVMCKAMNEW